MENPLIEHAARLLALEPTRCMPVETLHQRATAQSGCTVSLDRFVRLLCDLPAQFTVLTQDPSLGSARAWAADELAQYGAAMAAAGLASRVVTLCAPADPDARGVAGTPDRQRWTARERHAAPTTVTGHELLADVHDSLNRMVQTEIADPDLRAAASAAIAELELMRLRMTPQ